MNVKEMRLPDKCFKEEPRTQAVDTVVVHHISALNWDKRTEGDLQKICNAGITLSPLPPDQRKFSVDYCFAQLVAAELSYHYLIDRDGGAHRLVDDSRVAWHAGASQMSVGPLREWVNSFSIGISLIATHPKDDPTLEKDGILPYTDAQYQSLKQLIQHLCSKYPIRYVVGHDEIAPTRKTDPGTHFQWSRIRNADFSPHL